jgi:CRISPR-associated Csh1 family protein
MLPAVKALGEHVCKTTNIKEESRFVESSKLKDIKNVLCINFSFTNGKTVYTGLFSEAFDQNQSTKYLYRVFSHRRFEVTPTSKMSNPEKLKKRFALWFKQCCSKYLDSEESDSSLLQALKNEFLGKIDQIFSDIDERFKTLNKDEARNTIVTITIDSEKHLGDFKVFKEILKKESCSGYYAKHNVESKGKGKCYLCGEEKEVLGFASPFPVYTLDQKGFAPNFLQEDAWKRLPLCMDCAILSSVGREFVERYLFKRFYGINFYVIPSFAFKFDDEVLDYIVKPGKSYWAIVGNEDDISEIMAEKFEQATLTFVFTRPEKATFRIVRYVEDVPPSYLK